MTLGDFVHSHALILIPLAWAAYVTVVAVQNSRDNKQARADLAAALTTQHHESGGSENA